MKIVLFVTLAIAICFSVYAANDSRSGVWTADLVDDKIQMTLFHSERNNLMGFDEPLSAYSGLTKADLLSTAANVQFELRRPAGVIAFEGRVANGTGAGHYRFTPNDAFIPLFGVRATPLSLPASTKDFPSLFTYSCGTP